MTYPVHDQPRDHRGRFIPGASIVRRPDGEWSWTRWLGPEPPEDDMASARGCLWATTFAGLFWLALAALVALLVLR